MKIIYASHDLLVTAAAGAGAAPAWFAFVVHSKARRAAFLFPTHRQQLQHTQRSSTHLLYYKPDEPFSERLNQVQSELESVKDEGLQ